MMKMTYEWDVPRAKFEYIKSGYLTFMVFENVNGKFCFQKGDILKLFKSTECYSTFGNYITDRGNKCSFKDDAEQMEVHIDYVDYSIPGYVVVGINAVFLED